MDREEAVNRKFPTVYRGLDEQEVRAHLRNMQEEIDKRDEKIRQLEGMLDEKEENLNSFRNVETSINEAILTAQRAGDEAKRTAQARAEEIIRAAEAERERVVDESLARARHIANQTEDMKRQSKIFRARFKMLVEAQLDLLKSDDWDYLLDFDKNLEHRVDDLEAVEKKQDE
ncbi:DivIVA domain-containing protein [Salinicoccus roseus]|uniref:DivIVA domain-containing protein n=1 Tax=Salinicoccus roseus TaxID=45670 RepID=UPI0035241201